MPYWSYKHNNCFNTNFIYEMGSEEVFFFMYNQSDRASPSRQHETYTRVQRYLLDFEFVKTSLTNVLEHSNKV